MFNIKESIKHCNKKTISHSIENANDRHNNPLLNIVWLQIMEMKENYFDYFQHYYQ